VTVHIEIVQRPLGEAPEWVRDAWIGIRLPLIEPARRVYFGFGVLSGPAGFFRQLAAIFTGRAEKMDGYAVNALRAIEALDSHNPDAAHWWRESTPHFLNGKRSFVFDSYCCVRRKD